MDAAPEVAFNPCSEKSRQAAGRRYSCPHITSFSHIWNIEIPCGRRPEADFNTCSETSELSACRRYSRLFCTHITSFSPDFTVTPSRFITHECFSSAKQGDRDGF